MKKISAIIITFNEEKNIKECLENLEWCNEIVIVDSYSEDKTLEIAKKFKTKIYQKKWMGYGKQKNYALSKATNQWVLVLDADERLEPRLKKEIKNVIKRTDKAGFLIPRKNFIFNKFLRFGGAFPDYQLRLFRKDKGKFDNAPVHENVLIKGEVGKLKNMIIHKGVLSINLRVKTINERTNLEVKKKKYRFSYFNFFLRPLFRFLYHFILKAGFLEGVHGLYYSYERAMYEFLRQAKLWEEKRKKEK